jgi:hypothetical protein
MRTSWVAQGPAVEWLAIMLRTGDVLGSRSLLSSLKFSVVFLSSSCQIPVQYLLSHSLHFIIRQTS